MNLEVLKSAATSKFARGMLQTQKHSPKILFIAGTVGVIGTVVLACRATLKVSDVLDRHDKEYTNLVDETVSDVLDRGQDVPDLTERNKRVNKLKVRTALEIGRLYAPAVGLGFASIAALTGSHFILTKRNAGVMAAYAAVDRAFKEYRSRVAEEYGEDTDRKFFTGAEDYLVEEKTAEGTTKSTLKTSRGGKFGGSPYAAMFDEKSRFFSKQPGQNAHILMMKQSMANDMLRANGHLFLNEVYDILGLPRTPAGAVTGWVWRREDEVKNGDNYVDFGIFSSNDQDVIEALTEDGHWPMGIVVDFNVDGVIYDLI